VTVFGLLFTPVFYTLVRGLAERARKRWGHDDGAAATEGGAA